MEGEESLYKERIAFPHWTAAAMAEKSCRKHPFSGDSAGHSWLDGFRKQHPKLTNSHYHIAGPYVLI